MNKRAFGNAPFPLAYAVPAHAFSEISIRRSQTADLLSFTARGASNASHFLIEGSRDGAQFEALGSIDAVGSRIHTPRTYTAVFEDPECNYYRIRQIDTVAGSSYKMINQTRNSLLIRSAYGYDEFSRMPERRYASHLIF